MAKWNIFAKFILVICFAFVFSGCGKKNVQNTPDSPVFLNEEGSSVQGMLSEPDIGYTVPEVYPAIIVDCVGYLVGDSKLAILKAELLPAEFYIIDSSTGETVFSGDVRKADYVTCDDGFQTGLADFSDFDVEGNYFIKCELLGCSKGFKICGSIYPKLLNEALVRLDGWRCSITEPVPLEQETSKKMCVNGGWYTDSENRMDVAESCMAAYDLMLAYEYHPDSYTDDVGIPESGNGISDILDVIKKEIDWLLEMQNADTGGVYTSVSYINSSSDGKSPKVIIGESTRATCYFCTTLARFSQVYKKTDKEYSSLCLSAAMKAWQCLVANGNLVSPEQMYRAACELYKVTGNSSYNAVISDYLKTHFEDPFEARMSLDAAVSYMSTTAPTEVTYCSKLMETFMDMTQAKAGEASKARFLVQNETGQPAELLRNTSELVIIDYIISSREYENIEKNYLHYFCGRNEYSAVIKDSLSTPDEYAMYIFLLGKLSDPKVY